MTEEEIRRNQELSNEFDVIFNSITSNQAPGLDEYEKSVILTKAQDEVVKKYFNPRSNKTQEGFDDSERRQIDFSMITKAVSVYKVAVSEEGVEDPEDYDFKGHKYETLADLVDNFPDYTYSEESIDTTKYKPISQILLTDAPYNNYPGQIVGLYDPFKESIFDDRKETKSISIPNNVLMIINEYVKVIRNGEEKRLNIIPVSYVEYNRVMSKPFKRPTKNTAWRLLDNSQTNTNNAEIIVGPGDNIIKYVCRYIKRPRAIRLIDFTADNLTIDGGSTAQSCELDPILIPEIVQRGAELAKAIYQGDLNSTIALGQSSQTDIGMVASTNQR